MERQILKHILKENIFKQYYRTFRLTPARQCSPSIYLPPDKIHPSKLSGIDYLRDPDVYKGLSFTIKERIMLRIHGLLPPVVKSQEEQIELINQKFDDLSDNLLKYSYLMSILDRNERLYFAYVTKYIEKCLPIVYTPTVGLACQKFGYIYTKPRGLYISKYDIGNIYELIRNWPNTDVKVIVVTDGERVLGLGDLGAFGMGIPIGKLNLYTALGRIPPRICLPIMLDVGTNNEALLNNPSYIGIRDRRCDQNTMNAICDEFMMSVTRRFGQEVLVQFEDFAIHNAYRLLNRYRNEYCTFNDDIQGTAAVAVAGLIAAMRALKKPIGDNTILFQGAGSAAQGIAHLLVMAMENEGVAKEDALNRIWMNDKDGLLTETRAEPITDFQRMFSKHVEPMKGLINIVKFCKPTVIIGVSAQKGAFTIEVLDEMAKISERPVIFALSNPTDHAECTAEEAITVTKGKCLFASGSPFPPTVYSGKTYRTAQGNNSYIFPGVGLGVICAGMVTIPEEIFLLSAKTLASLVTDKDLEEGALYPSITHLAEISFHIAKCIVAAAYETGTATFYPQPKNLEKYIQARLYDTNYPQLIPNEYEIPVKTVSIAQSKIHKTEKVTSFL